MADTTRARKPPSGAGDRVLLVWSGTVQRVPLPKTGTLVLGRGADADVRIADESLSRQHARLAIGSSVTVEDLGSRNGTKIGGTSLKRGEQRELGPGAVAELGDAVVSVQWEKTLRRGPSADGGPIVVDPAMRELYQLLDVVAPSEVPVLVLGETGTGKDVYARALHARSQRRTGPFVALSCAALPDSTLEAELFGYERGAFTGAVTAKPGLFETASGGTLFLDELGDLPLTTQVKLLRVLETGEAMRLGSVKPTRLDFRLVAATNRDLDAAIKDKTFRADLFFRVNGFSVTLPPLRERSSEIVPLAEAFLAQAAAKARTPAPVLGAATQAALRAHPWPGNVRELKSVIERALVVADGARTLEPAMLQLAEAPGPAPRAKGLHAEVEAVERARILAVLDACEGNQSRAAKELGIARGTLLARLDQFGIARPRKQR